MSEMTNTEIPTGTRAVVIAFTGTKKHVTFDMLRQPYGVTLAQLTSQALAAAVKAGIEVNGYEIDFYQ